MQETPYEKGFAFVSYLRAVSAPPGTPTEAADAAFDAWLRAYTSEFAFRSVTPTDMLESFFRAFPGLRGDWSAEAHAREEAAEAAEWWGRPGAVPEDFAAEAALPPYDPATAPPDARGRRGVAYRAGFELVRWMHAPGWPPYYPPQADAQALSDPADACLAAWLAAADAAGAAPLTPPALGAGFSAWPTLQKLHFLDGALAAQVIAALGASRSSARSCPAPLLLPPCVQERRDARVGAALLAALDAAYGLGASGNAEVRLRWSQLVGGAGYDAGFASVREFVHSTGARDGEEWGADGVVHVSVCVGGTLPLPHCGGAGKLKYITPIFRALWGGPDASRALAPALFAEIRPGLHPAVRARVEGVLGSAQ